MCNENKQEMDRVELKAYPSIDGLFIGSININSNEVGLKSQPQNEPDTVIIVDRSGSMGNYVSKIVNQVRGGRLYRRIFEFFFLSGRMKNIRIF